ncbi:hypothetical protein J3E68DRAFT_153951 [Trichoderma sp. SZMC 28012]
MQAGTCCKLGVTCGGTSCRGRVTLKISCQIPPPYINEVRSSIQPVFIRKCLPNMMTYFNVLKYMRPYQVHRPILDIEHSYYQINSFYSHVVPKLPFRGSHLEYTTTSLI